MKALPVDSQTTNQSAYTTVQSGYVESSFTDMKKFPSLP
jgi:hypothetical protein